MIVLVDGELVAPERATVSIFDRGFLYGDGLFETLRTWSGVALDLEAHLDRLGEAAARLSLQTVPRGELAASIERAVELAGPGDHRVRVTLTRGPGRFGARLADLGPGRTIVVVEPLPEPPPGVSLAVVDWPLPRRAAAGVKSLAYLDEVLARELAAAAGADDALRLAADGTVAECAAANVFVVIGATIATPPVELGVLPGIVRARVIASCPALGLACEVRPIELRELRSASEVFVTSSLRGVAAVTRLDGELRTRGPITARVADAYVVESDGYARARRLL